VGINQRIFHSWDGTNIRNIFFIFTPGSMRLYGGATNASGAYGVKSPDWVAGQWYSMCTVRPKGATGTNLKAYVDGSPFALTVALDPGDCNVQATWIGRSLTGTDYYSNSPIALVYTWNRALSAEEVAWLHREPFAMFKDYNEIYYSFPWTTAGAIMNLIQGPNLGADLFNGALR
jgi:hypothetical protein